MAIVYKIDVLAALKAKGYSTYRLRQEKLIGVRSLEKIRAGGLPSMHELDILCTLLQLQPADIIEHSAEALPDSAEASADTDQH